jgi:hypothetical protein
VVTFVPVLIAQLLTREEQSHIAGPAVGP